MAIKKENTDSMSLYNQEKNLPLIDGKKQYKEWQDFSGDDVEDYITRRINENSDNTIVNADFAGTTLTLHKASGDPITCEVAVVDPSYTYGIKIYGLDYNGTIIETGSNTIQYNSSKTYKLGIAMYAIMTTTVITDRVGTFRAKIKYGNVYGEFIVPTFKFNDYKQEDNTINWDTLPESVIQWIDISELFLKAQQDNTITASIGEGFELAEDTSKFSLVNEVLVLTPPSVVITKDTSTNFTLTGNSLAASNYKLVGWCNGVRVETSSLLYDQLKPGINQLVLKASLKSGSVESEYVSVDIICTAEDYKETSVVVNKVSNTLPNNGMATLYQISVYNPNLEDVNISTYLEETSVASGDDPVNLIKSLVYSASDFQESNNTSSEQQKYIEVNSSGASRYLYVKVNGTYYIFWTISSSAATGIRSVQYKTMSVEKVNPNLTYYSDQPPLYNFDQIGGYVNNLFITKEYAAEIGQAANVVEDIEVSDGWQEEEGRVYFKASGQNKNLLKSPIPLNLGDNFSIEMGFRTYNISSEDESIIDMGYFQLRPTQVCWNTENASIFKQRNASFQEGIDNHVVITFHKNFDAKGLYYPDYLQGTYQTNFDQYTGKITLARIFINGVIDREIMFEDSDKDAINSIANWTMQLNAKSSDINIYLFRVYNNLALDFSQVQRNYISFLPKKSDKEAFYDANDILDPSTGEISFDLARKKYNTLLYVMPKGTRFPNRTTEVVSSGDGPVTLFVGYANETINKSHGGRLNYGKIKAQGSSAKKYLIHNVQYDLNKYEDDGNPSTFIPYSQLQENNTFPEGVATEDCYYMPKYTDQYTNPNTMKITKLVGKVNFASSMQSHKIGSCKLFDDAFKKSTNSELPSGGRKAVHEEPFLYFYLETELEDVSNFQLADALKSDNIRFMGFQTWGSGKGDKATFGYDKKKTPGYIMLEGGENGDITVQFRCPWHELQRGNAPEGSTGLSAQPTCTPEHSKEKPWEYLFIDDESIVHNDEAAWDIDFGCHDNKVQFQDKEEVHKSVKAFREFYDFVYSHDYNFIEVGKNDLNTDAWDTTKRYVINATSFEGHPEFVKAGDMYRYNIIEKAWVPAGLYCKQSGTNKVWEQYNVLDISGEYDIEGARLWMKKDFTLNIKKYVDVDDIAFHQAFIKFVSGTDNRAKNTYFQIIGPLYEEGVDSGKGDRLVRMVGDDLDTIFLTDNNGLQSKPYDLLEPSYQPLHKDYWGDSGANLFFVLFDQCFEKVSDDEDIFAVYGGTTNIKNKLKGIIEFAGINYNNVGYTGNYMYNSFFSVQEKDFPAVAYNHTAKIYYENAQMILNSGVLGSSVYNNNGVVPITQSHGSGIGGEKQFLVKRLNFLQTYVQDINNDPSFPTSNSAAGRYTLKLMMDFEPYQSFYPIWYYAKPEYMLTTNTSEYDALNNLAEVGKKYSIKLAPTGEPPVNHGIGFEHLYKTLSITGLKNPDFGGKTSRLDKLTELTVDNQLLEDNVAFFGADYPEYQIDNILASFAVLKDLKLRNLKLPDTVPLQNFYKLESIDLEGSSRVTEVILPQTGRLKTIKLPESIELFRIYNNPGLIDVSFEGFNNLNTVYIDCAKCGLFNVEQFCNSLKEAPLKEITLKNINNIKISEEALIALLTGTKYTITGELTIVDENGELKEISFDTKKLLVNTFGNIDTGEEGLKINYKQSAAIIIEYPEEVDAFYDSKIGGEQNMGNPFVVKITGNAVNIIEGINPENSNINHRLDIKYNIVSGNTSEVNLDEISGILIFKKLPTTNTTVKITINNNRHNGSNPTKLNFKWTAPKIGYFAYSDGTFSPNYYNNKYLIGIVYDKKETDPNNGVLYVLGTQTTNDTLQVSYVSNDFEGTLTESLIVEAFYKAVDEEFKILDNYPDVGVYTKEQIISPIYYGKGNNVNKLESYGKSDTEKYVNFVNSYILPKLYTDSKYASIKSYIKQSNIDGQIVYYIDTLDNLNNICNGLKNINIKSSIQDAKHLNPSIVFPYFYAAWLYKPENIGVYNDLQWYAPSLGDLSKIIWQFGYSSKLESFTEANSISPVFETIQKTNCNMNYPDVFTETPVFAYAYNKLNNNYPSSWKNIFGLSTKPITTTYNNQECYGYITQTDGNIESCSWKAGLFDWYSWAGSGNMYYPKKDIWAYEERVGGLPFTQIEYHNPQQ